MIPALQAIRDRIILDSANVLYIASAIDESNADAPVADGGWSVRQVLGHIGTALAVHAEMAAQLEAGGPVPRLDWDAVNGAEAQSDAGLPIAEAVVRVLAGRRALLDALAPMMASTFAATVDGIEVKAELNAFARHIGAHGLELIEALPSLRADPFLLNWILAADFREHPVSLARQQRLLTQPCEASNQPPASLPRETSGRFASRPKDD